MRNRLFISLLFAVSLHLTGCASIRETVNWEFKTENVELEPHEARRAHADYLADPD